MDGLGKVRIDWIDWLDDLKYSTLTSLYDLLDSCETNPNAEADLPQLKQLKESVLK
jgi:hypothetical protein